MLLYESKMQTEQQSENAGLVCPLSVAECCASLVTVNGAMLVECVRVDVIVAYGELTSSAGGRMTTVNDTAEFLCCTNDTLPSIHWHYTSSTDNVMYVIYNGHTVHPDLLASFHVSFNASTRCSRLSIIMVQLADAGVYSCLQSDTGRRQLHFHLVVFGQQLSKSALSDFSSNTRLI